MSNAPPSIGDQKKFFKINQQFDLPQDREAIIQRFKSILGLGGVQKVVIELGHPIKVERLVKSKEEVPQEMIEDSEFAIAMNSEIKEIPSLGLTPFEQLFAVFQHISAKRLKPRSFIVSNVDRLKKWLGIPPLVVVEELFCIRLVVDDQVPDDVLLIIAEDADSPWETPRISYRIPMDSNKENK